MVGRHILYLRHNFEEESSVYKTDMCLDVQHHGDTFKTYVEKENAKDNHDHGMRDIASRLGKQVAKSKANISPGDKLVALAEQEIIVGSPFIRLPVKGNKSTTMEVLIAFYESYISESARLAKLDSKR